jgi:hypothetical protein
MERAPVPPGTVPNTASTSASPSTSGSGNGMDGWLLNNLFGRRGG